MSQCESGWFDTKDLHLVQVEGGYNQLKEDTAVSKSDPDVDVLTFNLQQSLPTPVLSPNVVNVAKYGSDISPGQHNLSRKTPAKLGSS